MTAFIALYLTCLGFVVAEVADDQPLTHYDRVTIRNGSSSDSLVNVKDVPFGEAVRLKIALINSTEDAISIDSIKLSCNCISLKAFDKEVPAMGTGNLELLVKGEERSFRTTSSSSATIYFKDAGIQSVRFRISYKEMICFSQSRAELSFGEQSLGEVRRIPITISDDIKLENYRLELSSNLNHLSARLLNNNFGTHVEIVCNGLDSGFNRDVGVISILRNEEVVDVCTVGINKQQSVRLTPSTIVFEREDSKVGFVGHAILRTQTKNADEQDVDPSFSASSTEGESLETELIRIGKGTYRVKIFSPKILSKPNLVWSVRSAASSDSVDGESNVLFP